MSDVDGDRAPGVAGIAEDRPREAISGYLIGLVLAGILTAASFTIAQSGLIWAPAVPFTLIVLAVGQIGVHLVFFLHLTAGPDNTNNMLALMFGIIIVFLLIAGSVWIMDHLNHNMMPTPAMMRMGAQATQ